MSLHPQDRFDVEASVANHFAWMRTRMGLERTFLAWIRTAASLIGFGFTIVQFFERLRGMEASNGRAMAPETPRDLGLALIAAGVGTLVLAALQYHAQFRYLWSGPFRAIAGMEEKPHRSPAFIGALVLAVIGIAAFGSVFFRFL